MSGSSPRPWDTRDVGTRGNRSVALAVVADTSAFLAGLPQYLPVKVFTVASVISEIRDRESRLILERVRSIDRIEVVDITREDLELARRAAMGVGLLPKLSSTDLEVVALAIKLKGMGYRVVVASDDYSVQNVVLWLGLPVLPVRTLGIRKRLRYKVVCLACGYEGKGAEGECPRCGGRLTAVVRASSGRL